MGWVGGQLLLSAVVLPVLRAEVEVPARGRLVRLTARRFALIANAVLIPTLLTTGTALAWHRGVTVSTLWDAGYGRLLAIKLALVLASIVLAAAHGVLAGSRPRVARPLALTGVA